jgi:hypothetical protein
MPPPVHYARNGTEYGTQARFVQGPDSPWGTLVYS